MAPETGLVGEDVDGTTLHPAFPQTLFLTGGSVLLVPLGFNVDTVGDVLVREVSSGQKTGGSVGLPVFLAFFGWGSPVLCIVSDGPVAFLLARVPHRLSVD